MTNLRVAHVSMQFTDGPKSHTEDVNALFSRAAKEKWAWITGTEAGSNSNNLPSELMRASRANGYRPWVPNVQLSRQEGQAADCWIAVREDLIAGNWQPGFIAAIPGSGQLYMAKGLPKDTQPMWNPRGLVTVAFDTAELGRINVGSGHYLTAGRNPNAGPVKGVDHWQLNRDLAQVIGAWARLVGKGNGLAFYAGDQNMLDVANDQPQGDTFFGEPLTSAWDKLEVWQDTGHGNIDVIASYNGDKRVRAKTIRAIKDDKFFLNTDHFLVVANYEVDPVVPAPTEPTPTEHDCPLCGFVHTGLLTARKS